MIKWVLLMMVFLPDGSHINIQSNAPIASEKACEAKAADLEKAMKSKGAILATHTCEPTLPGEEA